jgi:hypothetical protein
MNDMTPELVVVANESFANRVADLHEARASV